MNGTLLLPVHMLPEKHYFSTLIRKVYPTALSIWHAIDLIKNFRCLFVMKKSQIVLFDIKGKLFLILLAFFSLKNAHLMDVTQRQAVCFQLHLK